MTDHQSQDLGFAPAVASRLRMWATGIEDAERTIRRMLLDGNVSESHIQPSFALLHDLLTRASNGVNLLKDGRVE